MTEPLRVVHLAAAAADGGADIFVKDLVIASRRAGDLPFLLLVDRAKEANLSLEIERKYVEQLESEGVPYAFIGQASRRNTLKGAISVHRACRAHKAQIFHSHLKIGIPFALFLGIPRVHTHHSCKAKMPLWAYRLLNPLVEAHVSVSERCATTVRGFTGRAVTAIRSGILTERVSRDPPKPRYPTGTIACIAVGRPRPPKNYALLVEAIRRLPANVLSRIQVAIAGDASRETLASLARQIDDAGLRDRVVLLGGREDIPDLLRDADLYLMSSAWEGLPIALLEATLAGLPFIATDVGGCAEVAQAAHNGIIVPPGDPVAFAATLAGLVMDRDRMSLMSRNAIANSATFDISGTLEAHRALYRQLLAARRGPS
jgi:glycosyltransferase involved in cell wall biosynthesis